MVPPARVRTLIDRQDTLTTGQSYFYFEAIGLLRMLRDADQDGHEFWFVLDEVFRGTNTVERVAAGAAVLQHLYGCGFVIARTHDPQLAGLLRGDSDSRWLTGDRTPFAAG